MSMAGPHGASEVLPYPTSAAPRRRAGAPAWLWATLLLVLAGALAFYAFQLRTERDSLADVLATSEGQLLQTRARETQVEGKLLGLQREHTAQAARIAELSGALESAHAELFAANQNVVELVDERGELGAELAEIKQMTRELSRMIDSGRLQVNFRRGRMVVELKAQVLFPSGSADLTADGKEALTEVARSLRGFRGRHFIVAGHTDNVPVSGKFANNWDLSSARAVTVTGALIRGGLRPGQLVAAGYAEHDPIARNNTDAGKQANRRIEIILEPRLRDPGTRNSTDTRK
ncbi:MAG: Flagellar motor rotation protein MotB [Myxococcaceae bacterium]|nr:Flagellar motor rotation protein MotB [Myxococcaceae bacterium]